MKERTKRKTENKTTTKPNNAYMTDKMRYITIIMTRRIKKNDNRTSTKKKPNCKSKIGIGFSFILTERIYQRE